MCVGGEDRLTFLQRMTRQKHQSSLSVAYGRVCSLSVEIHVVLVSFQHLWSASLFRIS